MKLFTEIQQHLESGGAVQITTYIKSWLFQKKHKEYFFVKNNNLYMKSGKNSFQLSNGEHLLVGLRYLIKKAA